MMDKIYDLAALETLLEGLAPNELDQAVGLKVAVPVDDEYEIVTTAQVGHFQIGLEVTLRCIKCGGQPETFYLCHGTAGWRYLFTKDGTFVIDTQSACYLCDDCIQQAQQQFFVVLLLPSETEDRGDTRLHRPPAGSNLERLN